VPPGIAHAQVPPVQRLLQQSALPLQIAPPARQHAPVLHWKPKQQSVSFALPVPVLPAR
jgi:hypothetical protein